MSMPERDTMRLRNKRVIGTLSFVLLGASSFWGAQGPATQPQQNQQRIQATPVPSDIDPSDPALPSWAKPATPPPTAANTKPATPATNVPPAQQPGQGQPNGAEQPNGHATNGDGKKDEAVTDVDFEEVKDDKKK